MRYAELTEILNQNPEAELVFVALKSPCLPELTSITVGPTNRYYSSPSIQTKTAVTYSQLKAITNSHSPDCTTYQISKDGTNWSHWDAAANAGAGAWTTPTSSANSNVIGDFNATNLNSLGSGSFYFRAFLNTDSVQTRPCQLNSVGIEYLP